MKEIGVIAYVTKGLYDPSVTYKEMEIVLYNGSLWEPKKETTGNAPPETQQNEDGTPASNEWWQLFLPGALGDDYVKKTDIAEAPTDTTAGKAGIVYPDGKTITVDENGMLTGAPAGKTMTKDEMDAKIASGELKDGDVIYAEGPAEGEDGIIITVDQTVEPDSENAVSGKAVYNELEKKANGEGITLSVENGILYVSYDDGTGSDSDSGTNGGV